MGSLKLVIFDLDGTLANSHGFLTETMEASFRHVGADLPPPELLKQFYHMSAPEFYKKCDGHLTPEQMVQASTFLMQTLTTKRQSGALVEPFYTGLVDVVKSLYEQNILLGVATNKFSFGAHSVLKTNGVDALFSTIQTADKHPAKPAPHMLLAALAETGVDAGNALMIGDSLPDMQAAQAAGIRPVAVTWAGRDAEPLKAAGAVRVLDTPQALLPTILDLLNEA